MKRRLLSRLRSRGRSCLPHFAIEKSAAPSAAGVAECESLQARKENNDVNNKQSAATNNHRFVVLLVPCKCPDEEYCGEDGLENKIGSVRQPMIEDNFLTDTDHNRTEGDREKPTAMGIEVFL